MDIKEHPSGFWIILMLLMVIYIIFLKFKISWKVTWILYYAFHFGLVIFVNNYIVMLHGGLNELLKNPLSFFMLISFNLFYIFMLVTIHFKKRT